MATAVNPKQERFDLRATPAQASAIRDAARETEQTVTAFVMDAALAEAQRVLGDRSRVALSDVEWQQFDAILERPATAKPKLTTLLTSDD